MTARRLAFVFVFLVTLIVPLLPVSAADVSEPVVVQPVAAPMTPVQPGAEVPIFMAAKACCLDDWQPGNCPAGKKVFAYCTFGCEVCGSFTCVPNSTNCLR